MKKALLVTESSVYTDKNGVLTVRGGGEMCFHNIAKSLLKIGVKPVVFSISEFGGQEKEEKIDGVLYRRINVKARASFGILRYLWRAVKESKGYDYVFFNQFTPHLILPWVKGVKIAVIHDVYQAEGLLFWIKQYGFFVGLIGSLIEKIQLRFDKKYAHKIMTVSDFSRKKIERSLGGGVSKKICVNPFPVNVNDFYANMKKDDYLLFVGRFVDYKNPEHVLFALRRVKMVFPQFKAVFIAPRVEKKISKRFWDVARELNLKDEDVIFRGDCSTEELKMFFARAKLFVQPSFIEGQGIVVLEALASKTPVVAYDLPAYAGMLVDGQNCILVEKGDVDVFGEACLDILREYDFYHSKCHVFLNDFSEEKFSRILKKIVRLDF